MWYNISFFESFEIIVLLAATAIHLRKEVGVPAQLRALGTAEPDGLPKSSSWAPHRDCTENAIKLSLPGSFCRGTFFSLFYSFTLLFLILILNYFLLFVFKVPCKRILF